MYRLWLSIFGVGYSRFVPGTCGSAVVAAIFLLSALLSGSGAVTGVVMLIVAAMGFFVTVRYGDRLIAELGPDPSAIVSDEQCGQAITYLWLWPLAGWATNQLIAFVLVGFALFRFFDILKPPPVRQLESVRGAWGVLLDDVAAGIYAHILLQIAWRIGWLG